MKRKITLQTAIGCLILFVISVCPSCKSKEHKTNNIDHKNLMVYYDDNGKEQPVNKIWNWEKRRQAILQGMQEVMGALPDMDKNNSNFNIEVHETLKTELFERRKISLQVEQNNRIHAYLFIPAVIEAGEKRAAILALHSTQDKGKAEPAGLTKKINFSYGLELVKRGYVVLVPDYPSFGDDSAYNFDTDQYDSGTMKGIYNHIRCADYLCSLDFVDETRLGVIGHSLGGHNSIFVGVFDQRFKAVVSSCGWTPFHNYYNGDLKGWATKTYMPRLRDVYNLDPDLVPFDFYEVIAALAPRAFFSNSPLNDSNFDVNGVKIAIAEAKKVYALYDAEQMIQVRYPDCEHDFPPQVRIESYQFLDKILKHKPVNNMNLK